MQAFRQFPAQGFLLVPLFLVLLFHNLPVCIRRHSVLLAEQFGKYGGAGKAAVRRNAGQVLVRKTHFADRICKPHAVDVIRKVNTRLSSEKPGQSRGRHIHFLCQGCQ